MLSAVAKVAEEGQSRHADMALQYVAEQRAIVAEALGSLQQHVTQLLQAASGFVKEQRAHLEHTTRRQVRLTDVSNTW